MSIAARTHGQAFAVGAGGSTVPLPPGSDRATVFPCRKGCLPCTATLASTVLYMDLVGAPPAPVAASLQEQQHSPSPRCPKAPHRRRRPARRHPCPPPPPFLPWPPGAGAGCWIRAMVGRRVSSCSTMSTGRDRRSRGCGPTRCGFCRRTAAAQRSRPPHWRHSPSAYGACSLLPYGLALSESGPASNRETALVHLRSRCSWAPHFCAPHSAPIAGHSCKGVCRPSLLSPMLRVGASLRFEPAHNVVMSAVYCAAVTCSSHCYSSSILRWRDAARCHRLGKRLIPKAAATPSRRLP